MRMTLVGPVYPYRGGIAHHTALLAQTLAARGPVQVVSFRRQYLAWLYPGVSDRDPSRDPGCIQAEYTLDPIYPWTWREAAASIARFAPDAIVMQWWTTFWAPAYASLADGLGRRRIPVLYVIHNVMPHEPKPWDRWLAKAALGRGCGFIAQADRESDRLRALLPGPLRIDVCPHPIYAMFTRHHLPRAEARRRLGISPRTRVALFFGLVRPYKGLRHLLEATALLKARGEVVHILVAGEFWEKEALYRDLIGRLGIAGQVMIDNRYIPDDEVAGYFSAADVCVIPYVSGTQSGVAKIAAAFGLPIILTDRIADADDLASTAADRVIVPAGDAAALADAISRVLTSAPADRPLPAQPTDYGESWERLAIRLEALAH